MSDERVVLVERIQHPPFGEGLEYAVWNKRGDGWARDDTVVQFQASDDLASKYRPLLNVQYGK